MKRSAPIAAMRTSAKADHMTIALHAIPLLNVTNAIKKYSHTAGSSPVAMNRAMFPFHLLCICRTWERCLQGFCGGCRGVHRFDHCEHVNTSFALIMMASVPSD